MLKANMGCGPIYMDGWLNIDISPNHKTDICCDILQHDFDENYFDVIYLSHVFEHFSYHEDAMKVLGLFYKWLKPNGILRLAVPSLEIASIAYTQGSDLKFLYGADFKGYYFEDTACERFNFFMKEWQHKMVYDYPQLKMMLQKVGFTRIGKRNANESLIENFNYDRFISESLYIESIK